LSEMRRLHAPMPGLPGRGRARFQRPGLPGRHRRPPDRRDALAGGDRRPSRPLRGLQEMRGLLPRGDPDEPNSPYAQELEGAERIRTGALRRLPEEGPGRGRDESPGCSAKDLAKGRPPPPAAGPPTFMNCERCGRLVCDQCLIDVYDPYYDYGLVCKECYQAKEQQDAKEREEYWREEEENKIEE
jgi:hypothetical protein